MNEVNVNLITHSSDLCPMSSQDFFHSVEFFKALENTPGMAPCMAVAVTREGEVMGHLLAVIVTRRWTFPPFAIKYGRVYGEGEYLPKADKAIVFCLLLKAVTRKFKHELCLFAEFSEIGKKMFGYRQFRQCGYVPIPWQEIHNSLHSMAPDQRLTAQQLKAIADAESQGVRVRPCESDDEREAYVRLLRNYFLLKGRRHIPDKRLFSEIEHSGHATNLVTTYKGHIIGGCTLVFSRGDAFLWFTAALRKRFHFQRPALMTVYGALRYAHFAGYAHLRFLDAGLPFKNPYREFILSFGGKPTAKYRWFQLPLSLINKIIRWRYGE